MITTYPFEAVSCQHKGSRVSAGHATQADVYISVGEEIVARQNLLALERKATLVLEADTQLSSGPADLALYIKRGMFITQWVLMDGDTVIGANYPNELPADRRPKPVP